MNVYKNKQLAQLFSNHQHQTIFGWAKLTFLLLFCTKIKSTPNLNISRCGKLNLSKILSKKISSRMPSNLRYIIIKSNLNTLLMD